MTSVALSSRFDRGEKVRFVARADNLGRPNDPWGDPRAVYLQHASDPIAWWNPGSP